MRVGWVFFFLCGGGNLLRPRNEEIRWRRATSGQRGSLVVSGVELNLDVVNKSSPPPSPKAKKYAAGEVDRSSDSWAALLFCSRSFFLSRLVIIVDIEFFFALRSGGFFAELSWILAIFMSSTLLGFGFLNCTEFVHVAPDKDWSFISWNLANLGQCLLHYTVLNLIVIQGEFCTGF